MRPLNIGIFTETYRPTVNGVVVSIDTFRHQLERHGHQYSIFAPYNRHKTKTEANVYRFPSIEPPHDTVYPLSIPLPISLAWQYLPKNVLAKLDIIHIQHFSSMGQLGLATAKRLNIPAVYTYHTMAELYTHYAPGIGPLTGGLIRQWTRHTAGHSTHVITPTQSVKKYLQSIGVKKPISVIPTGIDTDLYTHTPRAYVEHKYKIPAGARILLNAGRLSSEKNIDFLLQSFRQVLLAVPKAHLILAGDGPDRAKYQKQVKDWKIESSVTFIGFVDRAEVIKLFGSADLFVFPSVTDTQGIVVIEAMAAGAVPVAVDRYGPHDIIQDGVTGRLVDLNVQQFSGTIIDLLANDNKRRPMSKAARLAAKRYDMAVTAKVMESLYVKLTTHPGT